MTKQPGAGKRCIIVGAGIGGLTAGIAMKQLGFEVEVYEAAPELKPLGAGILLAPNALKVLAHLGCVDAVVAKGHVLSHSMTVTDHRRNPIGGLKGVDEKEAFGFHSTTIHRGALQEVLLEILGVDCVQTGKRCEKVEQDAGIVTLYCEDGTKATGDVLLAADGIHSAVREQLYPGIPLRYSGQTCWRGVADFVPGDRWSGYGFEMWGKGIRIGLLPISDSQVYWFSTDVVPAGGKDTDKEATKAKLIERFASFAEPVTGVLEATKAEGIMRHDLFDFAPISGWSRGHIALIGDAAHATTPNMGQGGCQAIEDAWGLQLAFAQSDDIPEALVVFEEIRRPKATMVVKNSFVGGKIAGLRNPVLCWLRNALLGLTPTSVILKQLSQLYQIPEPLQLPGR